MNQNIQAVKQQIESKGGFQSSEMLTRIFGEINQEFGKDFNVEYFFNEIWDQYNQSSERWAREVELNPKWDENGVNNGFNIIPSTNPNGLCAKFCLTMIPRGFRMGHSSSTRRSNRLGFSHSILLLCDYWFACLKINQENLLITSDWDPTTFENQYENVIESYASNHDKKVFVVEVSKSGPILRYPY